ncbi:hypothetical protein WMY93_020193 [Mugilogobius chulae]|uniref:Uncharacterized protein n=1 Tax=Mugilogobius chulae TaxID=88201 RepID=A0AAW0NGE5_9GOBI
MAPDHAWRILPKIHEHFRSHTLHKSSASLRKSPAAPGLWSVPAQACCCRALKRRRNAKKHHIKEKKDDFSTKHQCAPPKPLTPGFKAWRSGRLVEMNVIAAAVLGALFCSVALASPKTKDEHRTAFFGEDLYINVPPKELSEMVFRPRTNLSLDVVLLQGGQVLTQPQGNLSGPEVRLISPGHLILENLQEKDEGQYIIRSNSSAVVKKLTVIVRDCAVEQIIKYGDHYDIHLSHVEMPIALEFRPSVGPGNQTDTVPTEPPPVLLYNQSVLLEEYEGRLTVTEKKVTLRSVRMSDEGSFTVLDKNEKVKRKNCLNVREHQNFMHLTYGSNLKMNLYLHYSSLNVVYRSKSDKQDRPIVDQGVVVAPLDSQLEGRLTVEGAVIHMKKLLESDTGLFKITDLAGNLVAHVYIEVELHKRNEKSKKLTLLAQQNKGDGEAFRQVVHEAYTRFTEDSLMQSICDQPSESTEVTIKGLEVSKPGRYQTLPSDNNLMEMSDSGVEFNSSGLPLDSDTDGGMTYASHKPLLNAVSPTAVSEVPANSPDVTAPDGELTRTPDSVLSASPASNPRSYVTAAPDGSQQGAASPGAASRGTTESTKTEGGGESGEVVQNEAAQST